MADKYTLWTFEVRNPETGEIREVEENAETQAEAIKKIQAACFLSNPSVEDFTLTGMIDRTISLDGVYKTRKYGERVQLTERNMKNLQFHGTIYRPNHEGGPDLSINARWSINGFCIAIGSSMLGSKNKSDYDLVTV